VNIVKRSFGNGPDPTGDGIVESQENLAARGALPWKIGSFRRRKDSRMMTK